MAHYTELTQDYLAALSDFCNANCELHQGQFEPEILKKRIFDDPSHRNEHGFLLFDNKKIIGCTIGVTRREEGWLKSVRRSHFRAHLCGKLGNHAVSG